MHILTQKWVLVGSRHDLQPLRFSVVSEPSPSGTLDAGSSGVELFYKSFNAPEFTVDGFLQRTRLECALGCLGRSEVFPEEGVVDVTY